MADKDDDKIHLSADSQERAARVQSDRARHPLLYMLTRLLNSQYRVYRLQQVNGPEKVIEDEIDLRESILNELVKVFPKREFESGMTYALEDVLDILQDELDGTDTTVS